MLIKSGKLDPEGLDKIFRIIDFKPKEQEMKVIMKNLFRNSNEIGFEMFLKIYSLNLDPNNMIDIKNVIPITA